MLCPTVWLASYFYSCLRAPIFRFSFFFIVVATGMWAQSPIRITVPVEDSSRAVVAQSRLAVLRDAREIAPLAPQENLDRMVLAMKIAPEQQAELKALLESQQTRGSQNYHAWLTPEEFGRRFGPAPEDIAKVSGWLQQEGFRVDSVAKSGTWIQFSGTAGQVNSAFHTQMLRFEIGGETHIANASDISIPAALAPLVGGVPLHDFFAKPTFVNRHAPQLTAGPEITAPWNSAIAAIVPGDLATIYDLNPLYQAGLNGSGQTIAIVAEADIVPSDIATFQKVFGLPLNPPNVIVTGVDPGTDLLQGYGAEATIDTEWALGVAPGATVDLVVSEPSNTTDGVALAAMYIVEQNLAQIVSASYGECEQNLGTAGNALWNNIWQQAAAQGMSVFVSSGDSGSVACNVPNMDLDLLFGPMAVNGLASTPFDTAVGGTEFNETVNGGSIATYWNTTNGSSLASAKGYIPEMVWNDSCDDGHDPNYFTLCAPNTLLPTVSADGGGVSTVYATPSWQTLNVTGLNALAGYSLPNQPGVTPRGVPDVALPASAKHEGYLFCFTTDGTQPDCQLTSGAVTQTSFQNEAGGTSFSAPAFAGIMAIVNQAQKASGSPTKAAADGRQGLANYTLYPLATAQTWSSCNSSARTNPAQATPAGCVFNDITYGNNGPPEYWVQAGVVGYDATAGYDLVTGLGSVDAHNLVTSWTSAAAGFHGSQSLLTANGAASAISIQHGQPVSLEVTVQKLSGDSTSQTPSGQVSIVGQDGTLSHSTGVVSAALASSGGGSATTGAFNVAQLPAGSYNVAASFPGDGFFAASTSNAIPVTVTAESSVTTLNVYTYPQGYGTPVIFLVNVVGASGQGYPSGIITLADEGTAFAQGPLSADGTFTLPTCSSTGSEIFPQPSTLPCFNAGMHHFSATYSGDTSFSPSPAPAAASQLATVNIAKGNVEIIEGPGLSFTPQSSTGAINVPVTVNALLLGFSTQAAPPSGTVQFFLNSTSLGAPVVVTGNTPQAGFSQASLPNVTIPQGQFTLSFSYTGDANWNPVTYSQAASWGVPLGWMATATTATIDPAQTATFNLTLSNSSYSGQVPLECVFLTNPAKPTTPPAGVQCAVSLASANLTTPGQTVPVTVTITSTALSRLSPSPFPTLPFTLPPVLALVLWRFRRRRWPTLAASMLAALALSCAVSCGGGAGTSISTPVGPPATSAQFIVYAEPTVTLPNGSTGIVDMGVTLTLNINQ